MIFIKILEKYGKSRQKSEKIRKKRQKSDIFWTDIFLKNGHFWDFFILRENRFIWGTPHINMFDEISTGDL